MVSSKAATPDDYIAELPEERRELVVRLRDLVNANIPPGYSEGMAHGMIGWVVPLSRYPRTHNGQPLVYAGLAAQKKTTVLYLTCVYASEERTRRLKEAWAATGRKLDMGKSCLHFKRWDDVAEDVLADAIASAPVERFIAEYEAGRAGR
ncbi:MAG TPA: DUF1801 domain-containing protein [Allosphingosinicella sp.]|nr:DUF1801 domain-containing protein [Allosphingosinicella sp.]